METLKVLKPNLTFSEALQALKIKKLIKVPEWEGYWFLRGGEIIVKTWDGQELNTPWLHNNVLREDWQIVEIDQEAEQANRFKMVESMVIKSMHNTIDINPKTTNNQ